MKKVGKERNEKKRRWFPGVFITAFAAAMITFFLLVHLEKRMLSDYEKEVVWVAYGDLQKSLEIREERLSEYFVQKQVEKSNVPEYAITDVHNLAGMRTSILIPQGTILSSPMFSDEENYIKSLKRPVIAGCKADDLYQAVSGVLRAGDYVNIYMVSEEWKEAYLLWENVLVYQTFDNAGNLIAAEDTVTAAARMNLLLEEGDAELLYSEISKGSLRMVKVWDL